MAQITEYTKKLTRKCLIMEELIDHDWETLIDTLVEMYEPEDIVLEISTAF